jgi:hypothetical protein
MLTKKEILDILMLLSALESWGFSSKTILPDYLHDRINESAVRLATVLLQDE